MPVVFLLWFMKNTHVHTPTIGQHADHRLEEQYIRSGSKEKSIPIRNSSAGA